MHRLLKISINLDIIQRKRSLYKFSAFSEAHLLRKHADTAQSLTAVPGLFCHRKNFPLLKFQIICTQICHAKDIIIRMHGIIGNMILDQAHDLSSGEIMIVDFFDSPKDHRMMCDDHICPRLDRFFQSFLCQIQCKKNMRNFCLIITNQKSYIVPVFCCFCRIFILQPCCQFLYFHIGPGQPGSAAAPPQLLFCDQLPFPRKHF